MNINNTFRKQISYLLLPVMMIFTFSNFAPFSYGSVDHLDSLDHLDRFDKQKTVSESNKIEFFYSAGKIIDESDGTSISSYLIARHRILRSVNGINQARTNNQAQWLISNGKDVVATTDAAGAGNDIALNNYTPYGETADYSSVTGKNQSNIQNLKSNINTNPFKYSGYYEDYESGLYYLNARFYSPELMRFINRDSYDLPNRYAYCTGNPISQTDPSGHMSWSVLNIIGVAISFIPGVGNLFAAIQGGVTHNWVEMGLGIGFFAAEGTVACKVFRAGKIRANIATENLVENGSSGIAGSSPREVSSSIPEVEKTYQQALAEYQRQCAELDAGAATAVVADAAESPAVTRGTAEADAELDGVFSWRQGSKPLQPATEPGMFKPIQRPLLPSPAESLSSASPLGGEATKVEEAVQCVSKGRLETPADLTKFVFDDYKPEPGARIDSDALSGAGVLRWQEASPSPMTREDEMLAMMRRAFEAL